MELFDCLVSLVSYVGNRLSCVIPWNGKRRIAFPELMDESFAGGTVVFVSGIFSQAELPVPSKSASLA